MLRFLWNSTRGHRLQPWKSPYLRWRIETYWGLDAGSLSTVDFWRFVWTRRADLSRFLRWAGRMRQHA